VQQVTILPVERPVGDHAASEEDKISTPARTVLNQIKIFSGGRLAEELSTARSHLCAPTTRASIGYRRKMVLEWGMKKSGGRLTFAKKIAQDIP
jgi:ATP-dependent Zn protease